MKHPANPPSSLRIEAIFQRLSVLPGNVAVRVGFSVEDWALRADAWPVTGASPLPGRRGRRLSIRECVRVVAVLLTMFTTMAYGVPKADLGDALREMQHTEDDKQLWLVPDVRKEMKPDFFARLEKQAAAGSPKAQATLGLCHQFGFGVKRDLTKAVERYEQAAAAGHAGAQNNLAHFYDFGAGVPLDHAKAHELYLAAAKQGLADAEYNVGLNYAVGSVVPQSWEEARVWYAKAAAQGHLPAMTNLGNIYLLGRGVAVDSSLARKYLQKPAEAGLAISQFSLATVYAKEKKSDEQARWLRRSAEGGYAPAQFYWAAGLYEGKVGRKDAREALTWARKAATGMPPSLKSLASSAHAMVAHILLTDGSDAEKDEVFREASIAAAAGDADGQLLVGICYHRGAGVTRDVATAAKWYRMAAEQKQIYGAENLGLLLETGTGVPRDLAEAAKWYRVGAEGSEPISTYRLGLLYRDGTGVEVNLPEAVKLLRIAIILSPADREVKAALDGAEAQLKTRADTAAALGSSLAKAARESGGSRAEAIKALNEAVELGQPHATAMLAAMYRAGDGVPPDDERADELIAKIGKTSDPVLEYRIGYSYLRAGKQPPADKYLERALDFWRRSARQGFPLAQNSLGYYYMSAPEARRDVVEAVQWLTLSAGQGNNDARINLDRLRPTVTPEQMKEGERRAKEFVPISERSATPSITISPPIGLPTVIQ